jgi:Bacterial Ig domain
VKSTKPMTTICPFASGLVVLAVGTAGFLSGCGGEEGAPGGFGTEQAASALAPADPMAGASLGGDMVAMPPAAPKAPTSGVGTVRSALTGSGADPKTLYLFYATGAALPSTDIDACMAATPPRFDCTFASTLAECQRQIQTYLDKWFADFNIVFTLTRPTSGAFYTEVVSSGGGAWCNVSSKVAGVAPFLCKDLDGGVAYTFLGGTSAKQTAVIVAQEAAHLVGLEHVTNANDIMYPQICSDCDGFLNQDLPIDGDRCDRTSQNSYQMLLDRLGPWGGGPKPSAFGCMLDQRPPVVKILEPADGSTVKKNFTLRVDASDDCELATVQVSVMPQSLKAESYAAPFEWDLTNMSGQQTITVTAIDGSGHTTKQSVTITAPLAPGTIDSTSANVAGCTVASSAFGLAGALPALGALFIFSRRRRPLRRSRSITGSLKSDE